MIRLVHAFFFLILILVQGSCRQHQSTTAASGDTGDSLLISMFQGPCFGACPEFEVFVNKDGAAWYSGRRNVPRIGLWKTRLSSEYLQSLRSSIRSLGIEQMDTLYRNPRLADYPVWNLQVSDQSKRKKIVVSHESPPQNLTLFREEFEKVIEAQNWRLARPGQED